MSDHIKVLSDITKQTLIELYEKMNALAKEGNIKKAKQLYRQMQIIITDINQFYDEWTAAAVEAQYLRGFDLEDADMSFINSGELKAKITDKNFTGLHMQAVDSLTNALYQNLSIATASLSIRVGRMASDRFAEITKKQALKGMLKGDTRREISKNIVEELTKDGFSVFTDRAGRQWQLDTYAEMNARTTLREAHTRGIENRAIQEGYDLLKVSEHGTTCELCAKYEGRVYSITGNSPYYPKWENQIVSKTHPNCRHNISIFQEKYYDGDIDELRRKSKDQTDHRTESQKKAYEATQEKKKQQRANKQEYYRYKARLGADAPKSLSGFIQMKKSQNSNWRSMQDEYKDIGKILKDDGLNKSNSGIIKLKDMSFDRLVPDINDNAKIGLEKLHEEVLSHGLKTGNERLATIYVENGMKAFASINGDKGQVVFTQELMDSLTAANEASVILTHNHPSSSAFSSHDVHILNKYRSIKAITVEGHDGTKYMCNIGSGQRIYSFNDLQTEWSKFKKEYYDFFCQKVVNEGLDQNIAWKEHSHYIMKDLANEYNWEYKRITTKEYGKIENRILKEFEEWRAKK